MARRSIITKSQVIKFAFLTSAVMAGVAGIGWVFYKFSGKVAILKEAQNGFQGVM